MMFCPKCGSMLKPKDGKLTCSCGYSSEPDEKTTFKEKVESKDEIEVVENNNEAYPIVDAECEKCGHKKAFYWLQQTRAADEPETKFYRCEKCKHTWRDYS